MRIRVERDLRESFIEICRAQDKPAAQVLRAFMREYVADHEPANDRQTKGAVELPKENNQ